MLCLDLCVFVSATLRNSCLLRYYVMQNCKQLRIPTWIHALRLLGFFNNSFRCFVQLFLQSRFPLRGVQDKTWITSHTRGLILMSESVDVCLCPSVRVGLRLPTPRYSVRTCISLSKLTRAHSYWSAVRRRLTNHCQIKPLARLDVWRKISGFFYTNRRHVLPQALTGWGMRQNSECAMGHHKIWVIKHLLI